MKSSLVTTNVQLVETTEISTNWYVEIKCSAIELSAWASQHRTKTVTEMPTVSSFRDSVIFGVLQSLGKNDTSSSNHGDLGHSMTRTTPHFMGGGV